MDAYEFSKMVESRIEELSKEEYLLKNSDDSKRLLEELLPISKLALALKQPGLAIDVEGYEGYDEADGLIIESGSGTLSFAARPLCMALNLQSRMQPCLTI